MKLGASFISAILEEVDHWFLIKSTDQHEKIIDLERKKKIIFGWKPPPKSWLKSASAWNKENHQSGASWILRNNEGKVLMHGRRSFVGVPSKLEASFESWRWAIESMKHLKFNAIIFAADDTDLIGAILNLRLGLLLSSTLLTYYVGFTIFSIGKCLSTVIKIYLVPGL